MPRTGTHEPLERRVDEHLRDTNSMYIVKELKGETLQVLLDELHEAEEELDAAKARVNRLLNAVVNAEFNKAAKD